MSKHGFNLTDLVKEGLVKEGQALYFVADPQKTAKVVRAFNNKHRILPPRFSNQEGDECVQKNGF